MRRAVLILALAMLACGDDDRADGGADTGRVDGGADTGRLDAGQSDVGRDTGDSDGGESDVGGPDVGGSDASLDVGEDAAGPVCRLGTSCGAARYCDYADTCGEDESAGACTSRPTDCPEDCPGVCGCDGRAYCNACLAAQNGFDVDPDGECEPSDDPCVAMDATSAADCDRIVGFAYDGTRCVTIHCECVGSDCGRLYMTSTECEAATFGCGGSGATCGGFGGLPCAPGEFCAYPCRTFPDATGTCRTQPESCLGASGGAVCGCDGTTYRNQCEADFAAATVASPGECSGSRSCGGFGGARCLPDEFCSYDRGDFCGAADAPGTCERRPDLCPGIEAPVCGCDGMTYSNECIANSSGTSAASDGACSF